MQVQILITKIIMKERKEKTDTGQRGSKKAVIWVKQTCAKQFKALQSCKAKKVQCSAILCSAVQKSAILHLQGNTMEWQWFERENCTPSLLLHRCEAHRSAKLSNAILRKGKDSAILLWNTAMHSKKRQDSTMLYMIHDSEIHGKSIWYYADDSFYENAVSV